MRRLRRALPLLAAVALLALLARAVDPGALAAAFGAADPAWLALTLALHLTVLCLKALRWRVVLGAVPGGGPVDARLAFDALFLGYLGNYVLPAKLGELARAGLYARRGGLDTPAVLATILVERLLDALLLVGAFALTLALLPLPEGLPDWTRESVRVAGLVAVAGLALVAGVGPRMGRPGQGLPAPLARVAAAASRGLAILHDARTIGVVGMWTALIWAAEAASIRAALAAFGHGLPWAGAVAQMVISSFAIAAPGAPAGLGVHQWVTLLVLAPWGVQAPEAIAASLVMTFAVVAWVVPLGLFGLWRQGLTPAQLAEPAP